MTILELEQRLIEIARDIEAAQTILWLRERERDELRFEQRRLIQLSQLEVSA